LSSFSARFYLDHTQLMSYCQQMALQRPPINRSINQLIIVIKLVD